MVYFGFEEDWWLGAMRDVTPLLTHGFCMRAMYRLYTCRDMQEPGWYWPHVVDSTGSILARFWHIRPCWQDVASIHLYLNGLVQDCSISIANALEILQSCTKPSSRISDFHDKAWGSLYRGMEVTSNRRQSVQNPRRVSSTSAGLWRDCAAALAVTYGLVLVAMWDSTTGEV